MTRADHIYEPKVATTRSGHPLVRNLSHAELLRMLAFDEHT